jgi:D-alanine transaminase
VVTPVISIDGRPVGSGKPGPVTRSIQKLYFQALGADVAKAAPWVDG